MFIPMLIKKYLQLITESHLQEPRDAGFGKCDFGKGIGQYHHTYLWTIFNMQKYCVFIEIQWIIYMIKAILAIYKSLIRVFDF